MKKKIITGIIIVAVVGGIIGLNVRAANNRKFQSVKTVKTSNGDVKAYLSTTATIKSNTVKDYYGQQAKTLTVNVKVGDKVKKGDVLVTYDVQDPGVQVNQAQIAYNNSVSQKNDAVLTNSQNAQKIADQNLDGQIADYQNRINTVNNEINQLVNEINNLSGSTNKADQAKVLQDRIALYGPSGQSYNIVPGQGGYYMTRDSLVSTLNQLKSTKLQLQPMSEEKMKQLDNAIANAKLNLDSVKINAGKSQSSIIAEFDGVITSLSAVQGAMGNAAAPSVTEMDLSNLKAVSMLGKYDAVKVQTDQPATIKVGDKKYNGKISFIAPSASKNLSATGGDNTLEVDTNITDNPDGLKVDFDNDIDILLGEKDNVLQIPAECIKSDKTGRTYVYVVQGNKAVEKTVSLGLQSDINVEILSGLNEGDKVISNPSANIKDGSLIKENNGGK